jgi:hypothetical protein
MLANAISLFSSRCRLHAIDDVVLADAALCADRFILVSETFGYDHDLIFVALRNAQGELTPRISIGVPAELFFAGAADADVSAGQGVGFVGKDGADDEEVVGVALAALAVRTGR